MSSTSSERAGESPRGFPATPGMALFPLSPGRVNRLGHSPSVPTYEDRPYDSPPNVFGHPEFGLPGDFATKTSKINPGDEYALKSAFSTSRDAPYSADCLPGSPPKHTRASADVHAMVSRFNSLDIKDHADLRRKDAAALKRAQMGREEAEAEAKKMRDELNVLRESMHEAKEREGRVAKRLDGVMEELHRAKETQAQAQTLYEKEVRKVRKEAFKSSSMLVRLQEELKAARNMLRSGQSELELEKKKVERRDQETFAAQYQLVGIQEELMRNQLTLKTVQDERDGLRMSLKEEEMHRCVAEGKLAVFAAKEEENFYSNESLQPHTRVPTADPGLHFQTIGEGDLRAELQMHKDRLSYAEEQIEYMKMECQFGCCSCQIAQHQRDSFVHDGTYDAEIHKIKLAIAEMLTPPASEKMEESIEERTAKEEVIAIEDTKESMVKLEMDTENARAEDQAYLVQNTTDTIIALVESDVDHSKTLDTTNSISDMHSTPFLQQDERTPQLSTGPIFQPSMQNPPATPLNIRTITTTTTVPLADHSIIDYSAFSTPTGLTREQAIEQLRQRRGRARSVASTPKKFLNDGFTPRRDVSAPDMRVASRTRNRLR